MQSRVLVGPTQWLTLLREMIMERYKRRKRKKNEEKEEAKEFSLFFYPLCGYHSTSKSELFAYHEEEGEAQQATNELYSANRREGGWRTLTH